MNSIYYVAAVAIPLNCTLRLDIKTEITGRPTEMQKP